MAVKGHEGHRKKLPAVFLAAVSVFMLTGCGLRIHTVKIVIPAGSQAEFVYSEEEVSPKGSSVTLSSGEGLGDTEVVLELAESSIGTGKQDAYLPAYLTPGMPVRVEAEKGAWFKIGVSVQNPTDEDIVVYVGVKGADVRIR